MLAKNYIGGLPAVEKVKKKKQAYKRSFLIESHSETKTSSLLEPMIYLMFWKSNMNGFSTESFYMHTFIVLRF